MSDTPIEIIEQPRDFTYFLQTNGAFILTLLGLMGSCTTAMLLYFLRSRCTRVKCCCMECIRQPVSEENLHETTLTVPARVSARPDV